MTDFRRLFGEAISQTLKDRVTDGVIVVQPGFWLVRLVKGGPLVPAMIARCAHEPGNPENVLDTGPILVAELAGQPADPVEVYTAREKVPISANEFKFQVSDLAWCREHAPAEAKTAPRKRIDLLQATLPF